MPAEARVAFWGLGSRVCATTVILEFEVTKHYILIHIVVKNGIESLDVGCPLSLKSDYSVVQRLHLLLQVRRESNLFLVFRF